LIRDRDPILAAFLPREQLYEFLETLNIRGHELKAQKNIFEKVYTQLSDQYSVQPQKNSTLEEIKAIIKQAVDEENPFYEKWIAAEKRAAEAEAKLADTHKWISSHSAADDVSAADPADLDKQTRDSSILHSFDKPYSSYNQAKGTEKEKSESKERSAFQEVERYRSSLPEDPPAKRRSTTPPNRHSPSPSL
jgi:cell pole-organizing protein PopZ